MSSVVIAGDTSGTVTLDAPAVAGSTVITLPATSGQVLTQNPSAPANSFVVDASGNVGIGTSSPTQAGLVITKIGANVGTSAKLAIKSNNTSADTYLRIGRFGTGDDSSLLIGNNYNRDDGFSADDSSYGVTSVNFDNGFLALSTGAAGQTNPTERMRITSDGDVLIGTTSPVSTSNTGASFEVNTNNRRILLLGTSSTANNQLTSFRNPNGQVGSISTNASATTYSTSSDYRLKENIAPMTGALNTIAQLKPVTYKWKADGSDGQGFIAHELQEVVPDCVTGEKDAVDAEGNPEYQGIDTSFLVATLTAAIQELNAKVEAQAEQIKALQGAA